MNLVVAHPSESLFQSNLKWLKDFHPFLAKQVEEDFQSEKIEVKLSKSGLPVPLINSISLHSQYDPEKEARQLVSNFKSQSNKTCVLLGLGFGYHLFEWIEENEGTVSIIEPSLALFKTWLNYVDLGVFGERVQFFIGQSPEKLLAREQTQLWDFLSHPPSRQLHPAYFTRLEEGRVLLDHLNDNPLRVLIVPPIYGGSLPTARHTHDAFEELGHDTFWVDCEHYAEAFHSIQNTTVSKENSAILTQRFMELMGEVVIAKAAEVQPDLILGLAQAPLSKATIDRLRIMEVPIAFWFVEDFRTLTYWKDVAKEYDYFFTIQKEPFHNELKSKGVLNPYYLPQACNEEVHQPLSLDTKDQVRYGSDVSFMGAAYHNRVQSFTQLLNYDFKIWGTGWSRGSVFKNLIQEKGRRITSEESVQIFNGTKVNLNLHSSTFHEEVNPVGDFVNPRTFEIAACEGFQLVDERSELSELFEVGKEIITFSSISELRDKLDYYLEHPKKRKEIAQASRARVLEEHTFRHRVQEMLMVIFMGRQSFLKGRSHERQTFWEHSLKLAGAETELGQYLRQFKGQSDFSLKTMTHHIEEGEGDLSKNELLLLMVDQVVKE